MSAFCGYEQEDERVKANYDFPQINLIIILLLCSLWGWQEKKGQGLSIYHRRNMKTEHNNGANTQGFNCYLDSPKKHLIKSFHTNRISQQQTGKRKSCFLQAVKLLCDKCWWICQLLWQVLAGIIYVIFLRLVLTNIWQEKLRLLLALYCRGRIELEMWSPLDGVAKQRFVCAWLAVHLCT